MRASTVSRAARLAVAAGASSAFFVTAHADKSQSSVASPPAAAAAAVVPVSEWRSLTDAAARTRAPAHVLETHLLHATLSAAEGGLERYEARVSADGKELVAHVRLGHRACGHPTVVHGGALAAVLDDTMGLLFLQAGLGSGVTANLNVNYRRPVFAGTELEVRVRLAGVAASSSGKAKKVTLTAVIADARDPARVVYTEATALFIAKEGIAVPGGLYEAVSAAAAGAARLVSSIAGGGGGNGGSGAARTAV